MNSALGQTESLNFVIMAHKLANQNVYLFQKCCNSEWKFTTFKIFLTVHIVFSKLDK